MILLSKNTTSQPGHSQGKKYEKKIPVVDLFHPNVSIEEELKLAYELRNIDIAYNAITNEGDDE